MAYLSNPSEREAWLDQHALALDELAYETDMAIELVHMAAEFLLMGLADAEIYDQLHAHVLSLDGQHNPLAGAAPVVHEIRRLVGATSEENSQ